ncbi:Vta1 like-domain-containing protein [Tribonema minus]|uniref:Vta1 like-domain-containing protein n=1 Tax=Tribonema minus TaxID=303371 RepID=A0A836C8P0_9STRA|nr:Vta1 like-domain-containing protein [Tribonema minus]
MNIPPKCKPMVPFVRRAEELDRDDSGLETKVVAYYCRLHAAEVGLGLPDKGPEEEQCIMALVMRLEDDKKVLPQEALDNAQQTCRQFALDVFQRADDEDRAGLADNSTAKAFHAAGVFFDILAQFRKVPLDEECLVKKKYAKAKAMDILKALRSGRTPTPGPVGQAADQGSTGSAPPNLLGGSEASAPPAFAAAGAALADSVNYNIADQSSTGSAPPSLMGSSEASAPPGFAAAGGAALADSAPAAPPQTSFYGETVDTGSGAMSSYPASASISAEQNEGKQQQPSPYVDMAAAQPSPQPQRHVAPTAPSPAYSASGSTNAGSRSGGSAAAVKANAIADATEYAKFAIAALEHKDMNLARQRLQAALDCLR